MMMTIRKSGETMKKIYKDQVLGGILVAIAAFYAYQTTLIEESMVEGDPGSKVFPFVACFLIGISGLILLIHPEKKAGKKFLSKEEWKKLCILFGFYILYFVLLWLVGYRIAVPVVLMIISYLFSRPVKTPIWKILIYTVGVCAGLYLLYIVVMDSTLPMGILFE